MQAWQARNWLLQQRFAGQEKEYVELKELADEIACLLGTRIYRMQRLATGLLQAADDRPNDFAEYDEALKHWNERLTSFYVRLPLLADFDLALRLETTIQHELVRVGSELEDLIHVRRSGVKVGRTAVLKLKDKLNMLQGRAVNFNKTMLHVVTARRTEVYFEKEITFAPEHLKYFSTWQLFKALFVRDIHSLSVTRSAFDS